MWKERFSHLKPCCCIFLSHASRTNPTLLLTLSARMKVPHQGDLRQGLRMHNGQETTHPFLTNENLLKSSLTAEQFYSSQSWRQEDQGDASQGSCLLNGTLPPNMQGRWLGVGPHLSYSCGTPRHSPCGRSSHSCHSDSGTHHPPAQRGTLSARKTA